MYSCICRSHDGLVTYEKEENMHGMIMAIIIFFTEENWKARLLLDSTPQ